MAIAILLNYVLPLAIICTPEFCVNWFVVKLNMFFFNNYKQGNIFIFNDYTTGRYSYISHSQLNYQRQEIDKDDFVVKLYVTVDLE